jgi:hypothetical protein
MTYEYGFHAVNTLILLCTWLVLTFMALHWVYDKCVNGWSILFDKFDDIDLRDSSPDPYLGSHKIHKE